MSCLVQMQKRPKFIDVIEKFQLSGAYPVFFAILCAISGLGNKRVYLPIISLLVLSVVFSILFVSDSKVFITPMFMFYYALGTDNSKGYYSSSGMQSASFDKDGLVGICILAAIVSIPFVLRLILDGSFVVAFKKRGHVLYSILVLDVSILLGGALSSKWNIQGFFWSALIAAGITVFYVVFFAITENRDAEEITDYTCRILVLTCLCIAVQTAVMVIRADLAGDYIKYFKYYREWIMMRENLNLSWGVSTIIGACAVLGIPASFYLAKKSKFAVLYYLSALALLLVPLMINTRSSLLVGLLVFCFSVISVSISGKNRKINLILTALLLIIAIGAFFVIYAQIKQRDGSLRAILEKLIKFFRFDVFNDRLALFEQGLEIFKEFPFLGGGWSIGASLDKELHHSLFNGMYHCLPIQMAASSGIIGIVGLLLHLISLVKPVFGKTSVDRLLISSIFIMILIMSLVDNFFFYPNFQIFYTAFVILAERLFQQSSEIIKERTDAS